MLFYLLCCKYFNFTYLKFSKLKENGFAYDLKDNYQELKMLKGSNVISTIKELFELVRLSNI